MTISQYINGIARNIRAIDRRLDMSGLTAVERMELECARALLMGALR